MNTREIAWLAGAIALAIAPACVAQADVKYPTRPVRLIVPYAPGGVTDIVARLIGARLSEAWGQGVVIENRTGASGNIAVEAAAKAAPDGYTLQVGNVSTNAINPVAFEDRLAFKPLKELAPLAIVVEVPHLVAASASLAATNIAEMVAYAKANPGKLNYGSAGNGSYVHLDMVNLAQRAGFEAQHVAYKGGASQMLTSLAANETQMVFVNLASSLGFLRAGRIKALATTWHERLPEFPAVATLAEQGFRDVGTNAWNAFFAPAGVPRPLQLQIQAAIHEALARPELREAYAKQSMLAPPRRSLEEAAEFVNAEAAKWQRVIREGNIRVD